MVRMYLKFCGLFVFKYLVIILIVNLYLKKFYAYNIIIIVIFFFIGIIECYNDMFVFKE